MKPTRAPIFLHQNKFFVVYAQANTVGSEQSKVTIKG